MDWIKVKNNHIFYEGHTKTTLWAWIRVMGITSRLEAMPTDEQILSVITKKDYASLVEHFTRLGKSVPEVLSKLLEDCTKVIEDRERLKEYRRSKKIVGTHKTNDSYEYGTSTVHVANTVDKIREDKIRVGEEENPTRSRSFSIPTHKEIEEYANGAGLTIDAGRFVDFYESKGWLVGKSKMKSWQAAVRNWCRSDFNKVGSVKPKTQFEINALKTAEERGY